LISDCGLRIHWAFGVGRWGFSDLRWPGFVPISTLLVGVRDLENARFIERFAEQLQPIGNCAAIGSQAVAGICEVMHYTLKNSTFILVLVRNLLGYTIYENHNYWRPKSAEVRLLFKAPREDGSRFRAELDCG
jgi:hypothetical protein